MTRRKKVGILTFHRADNYGAVLQAYALRKKMDSLGYDAKFIDYRDSYLEQGYSAWGRLFEKKSLKNVLKIFFKLLNGETQKRKKFEAFRKQHFICSEVCTNQNDIGGLKYDCYCVGSDQVWNPELTNYNPAYFFDFPDKSAVKISYAASFGKTEFEEQAKNYVLNHIKNIDCISVREESGADFLKRYGVESKVVLDPTLLLDESEWMELMQTEEENVKSRFTAKGYVFMYRMTYNPDLVKMAYKVAEERNLKIVSLASFDKPEYMPNVYKIHGISPVMFLKYIKSAEYIITDSFHGVAFSIIFHKEFFTLPHSKYGSRTTDLLGKFCLQARMNPDSLEEKVDYEMVDEIKRQEQHKAELFLKEAIDEE